MDLSTLCNDIRQQIAEYEIESKAYAAQIERGNDLFESARGMPPFSVPRLMRVRVG